MIQIWIILLVGVVVVVILGTILQRLGRMDGGCLTVVIAIAGVIGAYMLFTGVALCDIPVLNRSTC